MSTDYPDTMSADVEANAGPSLRAKLTRRLTPVERIVGALGFVAAVVITRSADTAAPPLIYASAVFTAWLVWMLARPMPVRVAAVERVEPVPGRCRWCGLRPVASICGGRADGGSCEAAQADSFG